MAPTCRQAATSRVATESSASTVTPTPSRTESWIVPFNASCPILDRGAGDQENLAVFI